MPSPIVRECEPIPGYTIKEFLGAGGYGEVWSAAAPGGLAKAIKFVYGQHSEKRAAAELKSLERIRELRHPFLLSLERYEVVDGRLVIVTELADCSLRERFNVCREKGLNGVPRDELLHYLSETANGLDFMLQRGLQHLDVKPANLLVLAGHIKIADFGLVKDLQNVSVTLIGGLTPVYSPPELFRGRPNDRSDQYSLAIVYQEMLTGTLPFGGASTAELAVQQTKSKPDLSSLPATDRPAIARALSSDPTKRFATCADLVDALHGGKKVQAQAMRGAGKASTEPAPSRAPKPELASTATPVHTVVCRPEVFLPAVDTDQELMASLPPLEQGTCRALAPLTVPQDEQPLPPVLFCGIGGTGAHVLRHLSRRLHDRFGDRSMVPTIKMLLLDTDTETLVASTGGDDRSALRRDETLALPLRRPRQYRDRAQGMLRWLNRRWLYNVPRSLRTEGLRPLGRLAMADHAQTVLQTIERVVRSMIEPNAIEAASSQTGEQFQRDALRIYLVASVAGGTGSGMVLDVAYALQTLLAKLGQKQKQVYGILLHSTTKNVPLRELAVLNTLSWLTEFNHFNRPGGVYPGDETCGLMPVEPGDRAFHRTYLSHLGDDLDEHAFDEATRSVANYVYLDGLTPAATFFTACRNEPDDAPELLSDHAKLRTFGLHSIACVPDDVLETTAADLCREVLLQRCGCHSADSDPMRGTIEHEAVEAMASNGVDLLGLIDKARGIVADTISEDQSELRDQQAFCDASSTELVRAEQADEENRGSPASISEHRLDGIATQLTTGLFDLLSGSLIERVDGQTATLAHAARLAGAVSQLCSATRDEARLKANQLEAQSRDLLRPTVAQGRRHTTAVHRTASPEPVCALDDVSFTLESSTLQCVVRVLQNLKVEMDRFSEQLTQLARDLRRLAQLTTEKHRVATAPHARHDSDGLAHLARAVTRSLNHHRDQLVGELADAFHEEVVKERGGWFRALTDYPQARSVTLSSMRRIARQIVRRAVVRSNLICKLFAAGDADRPPLELDVCLQRAVPHLFGHAGPRRLLAVLPAGLTRSGDAASVVRELEGQASLANDAACELTFCYEANWLSIPHFAAALIKRSPHRAEAMGRLHARRDVVWSSLFKGSWPTRKNDVSNVETTSANCVSPESRDR